MESIKAQFFGRDIFIKDLVQGVLAPTQPLDYALVGPKMIGKSRLLKYLASDDGPLRNSDYAHWRPAHFIEGSHIIVSHYDCDWPAAQSHLTQFISQQLRFQLKEEKALKINWTQIDKTSSPGQQIELIVRQLNQQHVRLVLLLDNFDHVLRNETVTPDMINELRPLTNELGLIVTTEYPLHTLTQSKFASPLFNVMHQLFIGLLDPETSRSWVNSYNDLLPLSLRITNELLELTGRHPFLLARINDIIVELEPLVSHHSPLDEKYLPLIKLRLAEYGRPLFEEILRKVRKEKGEAAIRLIWQLFKFPIKIEELPAEHVGLINWLINEAVVTFDEGHYFIFSPLLKIFFRGQVGLDSQVENLPANTSETLDIFDSLPPKEAELLRYFCDNKDTPISFKKLLTDIWHKPDASPRRVQEAIRRLRNSLNKQTPPIGVIKSERGVGYRFLPANHSSSS